MTDRLPWERPLGRGPGAGRAHDLPGLGAARARGERRGRRPVGPAGRRARASSRAVPTRARATTTATASTAATRCPTPARARSRRAWAARRGWSTRPPSAWDEGGWAGLDRRALVLYELHVGTFTPEGTFAAAAERLPALRELGVTAIELMPVATFPGRRNWGYDGVYAWAPHHVYGGPEGLAGLVAAAHRAGLGVILDVVYNHLGPGAEALEAFGPYHTDRYGTPWGAAMNFDDARLGGRPRVGDPERLHWLSEYHIDGLRVDAVHAIHDDGARHVLAELCARARRDRPAAAAADRRERPQRPEGDPPARARRAGVRRPVGRRLPPRPARAAHRRARRLLRRLRRRPAPGRRHAPALRLPRAALGLPAPAPRRSRGRPSGAPVRGLLAEPRPGGQPGPGRPAPARRPAPRRAVDHAVALRPDALHGRGVRRGRAPSSSSPTTPTRSSPTPPARGGAGSSRSSSGFGEEVPDPQDPATHRRSLLDHATRDGGLRDLYGRLLELRARPCPGDPGRHVASRGRLDLDGPGPPAGGRQLRRRAGGGADPGARRGRPGDLARCAGSATAA